MNDFLAGLNEQAAARKRGAGDEPGAKEFDKAAAALRGAALAMRSRAAEEITARYRVAPTPPGQPKRRRSRSVATIGPDEDTVVTRRRRRRKGSWWSRLKFW